MIENVRLCDDLYVEEGFVKVFDHTGGDYSKDYVVINNQLKHRYNALNIIYRKVESEESNEILVNEEELIRLIIDGVIYEDCFSLASCSQRELIFPIIYVTINNLETPIQISCIKNHLPPCNRC